MLLLTQLVLARSGDTVFIKRIIADAPKPFYHAIFIDTTAKARQDLTSFAFNHFDSTLYFEQLANLKSLQLNKVAVSSIFPRRWIALHSWQGKYYLYRPSDFGYHYRFELTDTTTIDFTMEGAEPSRLDAILFSSDNKVKIHRINQWEGRQLTIVIVDREKGIAVFSFGPTRYTKAGYQLLMVDAARAHLFPVIVNYCKTNKQPEFEFDKIDFKTMLK